jgi:hypothetical protein
MRIIGTVAVALLAVYVALIATAYLLMRQPPVQFASAIGRMPQAMFMVLPFETLWMRARAGALQSGDVAPDFTLPTLDKSAQVELAAFRGKKPVVLIFGSYT